jgi:TIR domain
MRSYQVVVLGDDGAEADRFRTTLKHRFAELHISPDLLTLLTAAEVDQIDRISPLVAVYFGLTEIDADTALGIDPILADGYCVIPAVMDIKRFGAFVPRALHPINGCPLRADDHEFNELCGVVLENLSLLRKSRRVFISYRRNESRSIAIQLYEELDRRTFDVFLDTHSIRPGEDFQEVLWHRLADTDVMVLLDTPEFLGSAWTEAELARANSTSLQILQVIWPDQEQQADASFSAPLILRDDQFEDATVKYGQDARLKDPVIERIALETESLRARALAARHASLVQEVMREADALGVTCVAQPGRYLELTDTKGHREIVVPTVGVPDAVRYQEIDELIAEDQQSELILIFDERGVRDRWLKHLAWLDPRMRVRSLRIGHVSAWLSKRFPV